MTATLSSASTTLPQKAASAAAHPAGGPQGGPGHGLALGIENGFASLLASANAASAGGASAAPGVAQGLPTLPPFAKAGEVQPGGDITSLSMLAAEGIAHPDAAPPASSGLLEGGEAVAGELEAGEATGLDAAVPEAAALEPQVMALEALAPAAVIPPAGDTPAVAETQAAAPALASGTDTAPAQGSFVAQGIAPEGVSVAPAVGNLPAAALLAAADAALGATVQPETQPSDTPAASPPAKDTLAPVAPRVPDIATPETRADAKAAPDATEAGPAAESKGFESLLNEHGDNSSSQAPGANRATAATLPAASDTARAALSQHAVPVAGVALEIARQARDGNTRFEIRLDPPELGRIDVSLEIKADGRTTTHLVVERAETLDLMLRDARSLERALNAAGLKSDDAPTFSLRDQALKDQASKDHGHGGGRDARSPLGAAGEEEVAPADARRAMQILNAAARQLGARPLDLRV